MTTSGQVIPRDQWLKNNIIETQDKRIPSVKDDVKVQLFGDVAVITCRNITTRPDGAAPPERMTMILAKKNGAWQQVLTQSTTIQAARTAP